MLGLAHEDTRYSASLLARVLKKLAKPKPVVADTDAGAAGDEDASSDWSSEDSDFSDWYDWDSEDDERDEARARRLGERLERLAAKLPLVESGGEWLWRDVLWITRSVIGVSW